MSFSRAESALKFRASTLDGDLTRKRLRERYVAIQFPDYQAVRADIPAVIRLARELFDDGERRLATEVLILAAQDNPQEKSIPLALLELAYLADDASLYCAVAGYFRDNFPRAPENLTVSALGRHIAPRHAAFLAPAAANGTVSNGTGRFGSPYTIPGWSQTGADDADIAAHADFRRLVIGTRVAGQTQ
ncbi:MAG: hypothetical protein JNJ55_04235 [Betaproteobacteria bacterium]|nr:hypothetical protein [Betaproteobacteria bacterium]